MPDVFGGGPTADELPRCWRCGRLMAEMVTRPWRIKCGRCKAINQAGVSASVEPVNPVPSDQEAPVRWSPAPLDRP